MTSFVVSRNFFSIDPDTKKPSSFRSNLKTHSIRGGASQQMQLHKDLKPDWEDFRAGRLQSNKSKSAYISRSWECDYPCALVLSGWGRVHGGGVCPTIKSIPVSDHDEFKLFMINLFSTIPMVPSRILEMFACIILKWHFDVKEEFPEHPLVLKVESLQSVEKLADWSECIKEVFKKANEVALPLHIVQELTVTELLANHETLLTSIESRLQEICVAQVNNDRFYTSLNQKIESNRVEENSRYKLLSEKMDTLTELVTQVIEVNNGTKRRKSTVNHRQLQMDNFNTPAANLVIPEQSTNSPALPLQVEVAVPEQVVHQPKPAAPVAKLYSLKDLQTVFFTWYRDSLWNYSIPIGDYTTKSELKKLSALMVVMKAFIPTNKKHILLARPDIGTAAAADAVSRWLIELREVSLIVQGKVIDFCKEKSPTQLANTFCTKAPYSAVYKLLRTFPSTDYPIGVVTDNITQTNNGVFNNVPINQLDLWRRRK